MLVPCPNLTANEQFAKYNPYVTTWERQTMLGASAFSTRTDTGEEIIHRLIIIKDGIAWMLNCVDRKGKTSDEGQKVFDSIAASFSVGPRSAAKPAAAATVKAKR